MTFIFCGGFCAILWGNNLSCIEMWESWFGSCLREGCEWPTPNCIYIQNEGKGANTTSGNKIKLYYANSVLFSSSPHICV